MNRSAKVLPAGSHSRLYFQRSNDSKALYALLHCQQTGSTRSHCDDCPSLSMPNGHGALLQQVPAHVCRIEVEESAEVFEHHFCNLRCPYVVVAAARCRAASGQDSLSSGHCRGPGGTVPTRPVQSQARRFGGQPRRILGETGQPPEWLCSEKTSCMTIRKQHAPSI